MRISDWSSDVCSSDLLVELHAGEEEGRADAEDVAGADRQYDQHRHVEDAVPERPPGGGEERPARIDDRDAAEEEQPKIEVQSEGRGGRREHAAHRRNDEDRYGEDERDTEAVEKVANQG